MTIALLDRLTGIAGERLIELERGLVAATADELRVLAKALRIAPDLLEGMARAGDA